MEDQGDAEFITRLVEGSSNAGVGYLKKQSMLTPPYRIEVEWIVVYASNLNVNLKKLPKAVNGVRVMARQPPGMVSYTELANYGAAFASQRATHVMLLSLTHTPGVGLIKSLLKPHLENQDVGVTGCTITTKDNGIPKVVEHGLIIGNGWAETSWKPHLIRQYSGFTTIDYRVSEASEVTAVSPYCMMTDIEVWRALNGLRKLSSGVQEQLALGILPKDFNEKQQTYLKKKILGLGAVSMSIPRERDVTLKQKNIRAAAGAALADAVKILELVEGKEFNGYDVREPLLEEDLAKQKRNARFAPHEYLDTLVKEIKPLISKMKDLHMSGVTGSQEEGGWDLSLRLRQRKLRAIVVPNIAEVARSRLPPTMLPVGGNDTIPFSPPSHVIDGTFSKVWGGIINKYWPGSVTSGAHATDGQLPQSTMRVVWQSFCCHCCGFSNEILHLVFPLQRKHAVDLIPAPDCFCQGYPSAVLDSLSRMHLPKPLLERPVNHEDIVIWVSHTDPGSYLTSDLERKKPTYVVGRSMYEFTKIPGRWVNECRDNADEIWVPSSFVRDVWVDNGVNESKVVLIPEAIDVYFFDPDVAGKVPIPFPKTWKVYDSIPSRFQTRQTFKFLSHFKWEDRKGWDILIEAYFSTFEVNANVTLIILSHIWFPGPPETHGDATNHTFIKEKIEEYAMKNMGRPPSTLPHFVIITSRLSEEDVAALYNSVDAFVLPTKGEGWGLPPLQAMSIGIPTATTNWSGSVDFLDPKHSFPIPIDKLEELPHDSVYGYVKGKLWARPSLYETSRIMRYMADPANKLELKEMGRRARAHVVQHYSEEAVAEIVSNRINIIKDLIINGKVPPRQPRNWG
eukprot:TRINITY_DN13885_c0_g1_i1.p1 TRINITY_DN13885_c0_g1~~TRINITY_DN13885_c0_g1_i1.p1  ORF type:complete len:923 (+),score=181.08 TRINITY_DN13885_c0_g1_i1:224-2770(+)